MRLALVALFVLLAPAAAAVVPPVAQEGTEMVASHGRHSYSTGQNCGNSDPVLGIVSADATSTLTHRPAGTATRYTLHLNPALGDAACPVVDVTLLSAAAWPAAPNTFTYGGIATDCGATGQVHLARWDTGVSFYAYWDAVPAACGYTFGASTAMGVWIQSIQPSATLVCSPVVLSGCTGAGESTYPIPGCAQEQLYVAVAGIHVIYGTHGCEYWTDGHEYASVGDGFGFVTIVATEDSCTLRVGDFFGEPVQQQAPCPDAVGDAVYGMDWNDVLP